MVIPFPRASFPLNDLPTEIIMEIVWYLSQKDLSSLSRTCKDGDAKIKSLPVWKDIFLRKHPDHYMRNFPLDEDVFFNIGATIYWDEEERIAKSMIEKKIKKLSSNNHRQGISLFFSVLSIGLSPLGLLGMIPKSLLIDAVPKTGIEFLI